MKILSAKRFFIAVLLAAVVIIAAGCANRIVSGSIERRVEDKIPALIGPADSYKVKVQGGTVAMARGHIREMIVLAKGVQAMPGLKIDNLRVVINDIVADTSTGAVKDMGMVRFLAEVRQRTINEYFAKTNRSDARIELLSGRLVVHAKPRFLGIPASVRVSGQLVPDADKLNMKIDKLEVIGVNAPSIAENAVERRINPVVDLSATSFSPKLESVEILPGVIRINGIARMAGLTGSH